MKLAVRNLEGKEVSTIEVNDVVFNGIVNSFVMSTVVNWQRSKSRNQVQTIKDRSEVSMTGKKAFRQKGTGSARRGAKSTNLLRGGCAAHGISYIAHDYTLPKKVRRLGLRSAISMKVQAGKFIAIDNADMTESKTQMFLESMQKLNVRSALIIAQSKEDAQNMLLAARSVAKFDIIPAIGMNVKDVVGKESLIMTIDAINSVSERLLKGVNVKVKDAKDVKVKKVKEVKDETNSTQAAKAKKTSK